MNILPFSSAISSSNGSFKAVAFFDGYFSPFCGRSWEVIRDPNGNSIKTKNGKYAVSHHYEQKNRTIAWIKVTSYITIVLPIIMGIGKLICRSYYSFYIDLEEKKTDQQEKVHTPLSTQQQSPSTTASLPEKDDPNLLKPHLDPDQPLSNGVDLSDARSSTDTHSIEISQKKKIKITPKTELDKSIEVLPTEIWLKIFSFLDKKELSHIAESCNYFYFLRNLIDENTKTSLFWLVQNGYKAKENNYCFMNVNVKNRNKDNKTSSFSKRFFMNIDDSISLKDFVALSDFYLKKQLHQSCEIKQIINSEYGFIKKNQCSSDFVEIKYEDGIALPVEEELEIPTEFFITNGIFVLLEGPVEIIKKNQVNLNPKPCTIS